MLLPLGAENIYVYVAAPLILFSFSELHAYRRYFSYDSPAADKMIFMCFTRDTS